MAALWLPSIQPTQCLHSLLLILLMLLVLQLMLQLVLPLLLQNLGTGLEAPMG